MSYDKTIWKSKDIITREKMQKIEDQLEVLSEQETSGSGSGTSDYLELENKPQINGITLTGNKSLTDLGVAAASDVATKYTKPGTGIPASDLSSTVQASLQKADTALQGENLTSVVNNYIETNFSNPSSPPLDRTLSSSASAAPADMVGDLKSATNKVFDLANADQHFYIQSTGAIQKSANWNALIIDNIQSFAKIYAVLGTNNDTFLGIAFYGNNGVIRSDIFISGVSISNGNLIEADVPANAVIGVICTRPASYANYSAGAVCKVPQIVCIANNNAEQFELYSKFTANYAPEMEQGTISSGTGGNTDNTKRIRTVGFVPADTFAKAECDYLHRLWLFEYDANKSFINYNTSGHFRTVLASDLLKNTCYLRFVVTTVNGIETISPANETGFTIYTNDAAQIKNAEILGAYPRPLFTVEGAPTDSDYTIVGNKLVRFAAAADDLSENAVLSYREYANGFDQPSTGSKSLYHYFGHCNTVDYNAENHCLIMGNGSGDYSLPGKIYIIPDFDTLLESAQAGDSITLQAANAIIIDCTDYNFGSKFNVLWGEKNGNTNNIAYLITANFGKTTSSPDAGDIGKIRRILLGMGTNELTYGQFISGKGASEFNGTFDVLDLYTQDGTAYKDCCQGSCYFKGEIVCAVGHQELNLWRMTLENGRIKRKVYHQLVYGSDGAVVTNFASTGCCTDGERIYTGVVNSGVWALNL